jgi:glycosyltransferase involved in cell wall biosynthesis
MRVVEIVYNWPAETFIQRHIKALQSVHLPVQVVARHNHSNLRESSRLVDADKNICATQMPNFNVLSWAEKIASLRFLTGKSLRRLGIAAPSQTVLLAYFERLHPDLIHFHDASLAASMDWIPNALGIPYTLSLRGSDIQVLPLQSAAQREATLTAIRRASRVHAVCKALGRRAAGMVGHDLEYSVIYTTLPFPRALSNWRPLNLGEPVHFITSGRLMWRKRYSDLLLAFHRLQANGMDAKLTIIGVGTDLDQLLYLRNFLDLESVVSFPGKLTYEEILEMFHCAHAYIQSSIAEGLSNALVEAMAHGLPVFATDVDGTREAIEDGVTGFLLPPLASQDWAEKLMQVQDDLLMQKIRRAAYEKAKQMFSTERHARAFVSFYEDAANSTKRQSP